MRWSQTVILSDEHFNALAEGLPKLRDVMCSGGEPPGGSERKSGAFRLNVARSRRMERSYSESQYISMILQDIDHLSRMFHMVQQKLRDYILTIPDVFPYLSTVLTTVTYVIPAPNASKNIIYLHLYEELITFA